MKEIKCDTKIEGYTTFLDWKNQHCESDYTTQSNLQVQGDPYQNTKGIFYRSRSKNFQNLYGNTKDTEQQKQS